MSNAVLYTPYQFQKDRANNKENLHISFMWMNEICEFIHMNENIYIYIYIKLFKEIPSILISQNLKNWFKQDNFQIRKYIYSINFKDIRGVIKEKTPHSVAWIPALFKSIDSCVFTDFKTIFVFVITWKLNDWSSRCN